MAATLRTVVCSAAGAQRFCATSSALSVEQPATVGAVSSSLLGKGRLLSVSSCQPGAILKQRNVHRVRASSAGNVATREDGKTVSPLHDIPLKAGDGVYNFVVEIPKESSAKFEAATDEPNTRIKHDTNKEKLRFHPSGSDSVSFQRREVLGKAAALMLSLVSLPALGAEDNYTLYNDEEDKYSLMIPQEWTKGEGNSGTRKVTAFFPQSDTSANVNIVITGLGADYTALGSFGNVDTFAENLVNSLDRAWQRPKGQAAKLVDARSRNGMYYVEYTIQKPGETKRHLLSVVGIASNGWINRLYTVTGQYWEDDGDKYRANLEKAITSFRLA